MNYNFPWYFFVYFQFVPNSGLNFSCGTGITVEGMGNHQPPSEF